MNNFQYMKNYLISLPWFFKNILHNKNLII
jgi:hypothetical protein